MTPPILPHRKTRDEPPLLFALPVGEPREGPLTHISRVLNGKGCACLCPKCLEPVIARQGDQVLHHFAHKSGSACSGAAETALHRIAKQCLSSGARFLVPRLAVEYLGRTLELQAPSSVMFDMVDTEVDLGGFRPDVLAHRKGHELIIEILVTHEVNEAKLERIVAHGSAALEIDLSGFDRLASETDILAAILKGAPRVWLHHPKMREGRARLEAEIAAELAHRKVVVEAALDKAAGLIRAVAYGQKWRDERLIAEIASLGLANQIGPALPWDTPVTVDDETLQAIVLKTLYDAFLVAVRMRERPYVTANLLNQAISQRRVVPEEIARVPPNAYGRLGLVPGDRRIEPPNVAVGRVLELFVKGGIVVHDGRGWTGGLLLERVEEHHDEERARRERRRDIDEVLGRILNKSDDSFRHRFDKDAWLRTPLGGSKAGLAPATLIVEGGVGYERMMDALRAINSFLWDNGPEPKPRLGLDLEASFTAERERREAAAERERQKQGATRRAREEAARQRVDELKETARVLLGVDDATWLNLPYERAAGIPWMFPGARVAANIRLPRIADGEVLEDLSRRSPQDHDRAVSAVNSLHLGIAGVIKLRTQLEEAARTAFASTDRADLFLKTGHSRLPGCRRPLDHCVDQRSLKECLDLLPETGRSRRSQR